jgi:hypothetical protein
MRRLAAHLALVSIWLGSLTPFLAAAETSNLHACCLRNGMHHCQGAGSDSSSSSTEFRATRAACPYATPLPLTNFSGLEASQFSLPSPGVAAFIAAQSSQPAFFSAVYTLSARGPPVLL